MKVQAIHRNARMSPRKVRLVASLLSGMPVQQAVTQLNYMPGKASGVLLSVLQSAIANATHNHQMSEKTLIIERIYIDEGLVMKRFMPRSKGMANPILKRTSHIKVVLTGDEGAKKAPKKASKKDAIATISPDEYVTQQQKASEEEKKEAEKPSAKRHEEIVEEDKPTKTSDTEVAAGKLADKENYAAYQQNRIQQLGGDKRKTNRRVSKKGTK